MTIEDELRATLHRQAAEVPDDAVARVRAHAYKGQAARARPSGIAGRIRRRTLALGVTGTAALAGAGGAAVALLGNASPAFAGWSSTPTAPTPGQLAQAAGNCKAQVPVQGLPLKLSDTRGPFTFQIYADDRSMAMCITGPSFTNGSGFMSSEPFNEPADQLGLNSEHTDTSDGSAYSFATGLAGANVTGATLNLADGSQIQATVQNGWFVAWWPSDSVVRTATVVTADGTKTQTFTEPGVPCSPKQCSVGGLGDTTTGPGATPPPGGAGVVNIQAVGGGTTGERGSAYGYSASGVK